MLTTTVIADNVGTITLNNPARRNALSKALVEEIIAGFESFRGKVRCVVLRTTPDAKVFSAGHDIDELPQGADPLEFNDPLERLLRTVSTFPTPVIAMIHGSVWGAGSDLVMTCDIVIGDETSAFAITPANLGLAYNTAGLAHFLRRLPLHVVKELLFTAAPMKAEDALRHGILNHLVPASDLEKTVTEMAILITHKAPLAVSSMKEQLRLMTQATVLTPDTFERIQDLRRQVYQSADYTEGIAAFHQKRKPVFTGK